MATEYIASTIPAQIERVSGTTLFHIAARLFDDALQWAAIASLNELVDPWIFGLAEIEIPPVLPTGTPIGFLQ